MSPKMEVRAKLPVILFDRRRDRHRETESPRIVLYSTAAVVHLTSAGTGGYRHATTRFVCSLRRYEDASPKPLALC
ncbi:hypothetical protein [Rhodopirellula bahusiensis]|uniref:hypothetical protein n=1 Tax=Rhodopirellula bahusiensis TaxID=2014065 RepID=UPI001E5DAA04|nr:hypothetical protein [Rhodopirellula bahusiensis]